MSNFSRRLLILALLSAFGIASSGSAGAAEKGRDKGEQKHDQSGDARQGKDKGGHDHDHDAGLTSRTSVVTVTNRGASPLTITAMPTITRLSGNGLFEIVPPGTGTPCAPSVVVVPGGGKCTIGVQYIPTDGGRSTARLTLTDTGAATPSQETVMSSD